MVVKGASGCFHDETQWIRDTLVARDLFKNSNRCSKCVGIMIDGVLRIKHTAECDSKYCIDDFSLRWWLWNIYVPTC